MTKNELEFKIVSVKRSIATKKKELQEEQNYLKSLEKALQEELRGDQMDWLSVDDITRGGIKEGETLTLGVTTSSRLEGLGNYNYMSKGG